MRNSFKKGSIGVVVAIAIALAVVSLVIGIVSYTQSSRVANAVDSLIAELTGTGAAVPTSTTNNVISSATDIYTGVNSTSTTATSYTLVKKDIEGYGTILLLPNTGALTLTLPASSTLTHLPRPGMRTRLAIVNATSTAAQTITIAAGTGTLLKNSTTTAAIGPGSVGFLDLVRKTDTDFDVFLDIGI